MFWRNCRRPCDHEDSLRSKRRHLIARSSDFDPGPSGLVRLLCVHNWTRCIDQPTTPTNGNGLRMKMHSRHCLRKHTRYCSDKSLSVFSARVNERFPTLYIWERRGTPIHGHWATDHSSFAQNMTYQVQEEPNSTPTSHYPGSNGNCYRKNM